MTDSSPIVTPEPSPGTPRPRDVPGAPASTLSFSRAALHLGLTRPDVDLAVHLGHIRAMKDADGRRCVARAEIDRVRRGRGFPHGLRERLERAGTAQGARLMGISTTRFTRLARLGMLVPVTFSVNRYRAVVWMYLVEELREFAAADSERPLLTGRLPDQLRQRLDAGTDLRARTWRGRYAGCLLRGCGDPWERAAVTASLLSDADLAPVRMTPKERARLDLLRPPRPGHGAPGSPTAEVAARLSTADDPDEVEWLRTCLGLSLAEARGATASVRSSTPAEEATVTAETPPAPTRAERPPRRRGILGRLRRSRGPVTSRPPGDPATGPAGPPGRPSGRPSTAPTASDRG